MQTRNHIMRDYAYQDNRSVSAMLAGQGDRREGLWLNFVKQHEAEQSMEELMESFDKAVRYGKVGQKQLIQMALMRLLGTLFLYLVVS